VKRDRHARCPGELRVVAAWRPLEDGWRTDGDAPRLIGRLEFSERNFGDDLTLLVPEPCAADGVPARCVAGIDSEAAVRARGDRQTNRLERVGRDDLLAGDVGVPEAGAAVVEEGKRSGDGRGKLDLEGIRAIVNEAAVQEPE